MRGLAWDDEPQDYLEPLKRCLKPYQIKLEIEEKWPRFLQKFRSRDEKWDFIITDLYSPEPPGTAIESPDTGVRIAHVAVEQGLPLFVITKELEKAVIKAGLPRQAIVKTKSMPVAWMADEICGELQRRGVLVDKKKVFVIYGRDRQATGARESLKAFLKTALKLEVEEISSTNLRTEIAEGLLQRMNDCGAFVAIYTPDDKLADGTCHPRLNVTLEIGIAMGLSRGLERLTILQRSGPQGDPGLTAALPTDLHGVLTMRFADSIEAVFDDLKERLRNLGMDLP